MIKNSKYKMIVESGKFAGLAMGFFGTVMGSILLFYSNSLIFLLLLLGMMINGYAIAASASGVEIIISYIEENCILRYGNYEVTLQNSVEKS